MKKKELNELRGKTLDEIKEMVEGKRLELLKAKTEEKASKEKNLKKAWRLRHNLSQTLTILREKEIVEKEKTKSEVTKI